MTGDPSPEYRPAEAACRLESPQDRPEPAEEVGALLRNHLEAVGGPHTADLAEAGLGVHPVQQRQFKLEVMCNQTYRSIEHQKQK